MFRSIVVGDNGSTGAAEAVRHATDLARRLDATLHLVGAVRPIPALVDAPGAAVVAFESESELEARLRDHLAERERSLRDQGVRVSTDTVLGDPAAAIVAVAGERQADLIVVGSRGMRGVRRALGSVPNTVSHRAGCSVLIVRTD